MNSVSYIYSNLDKNSKFLLLMIGIIIILLILIAIINFVSKKKSKTLNIIKNSDEFNNLDLTPSVKILKGNKIVSNLEKNNDNNKITKNNIIENKNLETNKEEVFENIETIDEINLESEEIIEVIEEENLTNIDKILLEMEKAENQPEINLTEFEKEQEENAIISYDELCKKAGVKKIIYKTSKKENNVKKTNSEKTVAYSKKYEPSKVISPIYGYQKIDNKSQKSKNLVDENQDDMEFLGNLKQFRSGLQ